MKKIGIMGGTFNPIHNAHLMMAQAAYEQFDLDEVRFMPSKNPPHKKKEEIVSEEHRRRMIQFAIDDIPYFKFSDMELNRTGITYTYDTLKQIHKELPDAEIYFILGGDSLLEFETWYHPEEIAALCTILAVPREGLTETESEELCRKLSRKFKGDFYPVFMPQFCISSAIMRKRLKTGKSVVGYAPKKVVQYINRHGLYGVPILKKSYSEKEISSSLESILRPKRYRHTLGVAHTAANLAVCHGVDPKRAKIAGLLHDCAKYLSSDEMYEMCNQYHISLNPIEQKNPALLHSRLGAYFAKERYGIEDDEIISAIACHTTGKPNMTNLEKIIYIADYIEPNRNMKAAYYSMDKIRKTCFSDLDKGLEMILYNNILYFKESGIETDPATVETYQYYKTKKGFKDDKA